MWTLDHSLISIMNWNAQRLEDEFSRMESDTKIKVPCKREEAQ